MFYLVFGFSRAWIVKTELDSTAGKFQQEWNVRKIFPNFVAEL